MNAVGQIQHTGQAGLADLDERQPAVAPRKLVMVIWLNVCSMSRLKTHLVMCNKGYAEYIKKSSCM